MTRPRTSKARPVALGLVAPLVLLLSSALVAPSRAQESSKVRFAAVGDFGDDRNNGPVVAAVAKLVKGWGPEFVITLGDNNYNCGEQKTVAENITKHYGDFIKAGGGNRFFPVLGNHDWGHNWNNGPGVCEQKPPSACAAQDIGPYLALFDLPGNERYYEFTAPTTARCSSTPTNRR